MKLKLLLKKLAKRGFATLEEKEEVTKLFDELGEEEQKELEESVEKVIDLPEEDQEQKELDNLEEKVEKMFSKMLEESKEKLGDEAEEKVKKALKKHLDMKNKKAGIYNNDVQDKRKELNEYMRNYMKAVVGKDTAKLKELTTDASNTPFGGYVVDSELSAEIRHLTTEYGVARREMSSVQLTKNSYDANSLATDVSVFWVDEGATINSTQAELDQDGLTLKKLAAIVTFTNELLEEQEIDLVNFIASRVAEGFAQKEDEAFFNGDGSSSYGGFTGLLNNTNTNKVTMSGTGFSSVDADDLIDMQDKTPQGALANAKYYMHRTIRSFIRKLQNSQGDYIYQRPTQNSPATAWGKKIVDVEAMPDKAASAADKAFVLFGDLKKACIFGYRGAIRADMFDAGTVRNVADNGDVNLITTDRKAVRWVERVGFITILPTAVTRLLTASSSA